MPKAPRTAQAALRFHRFIEIPLSRKNRCLSHVVIPRTLFSVKISPFLGRFSFGFFGLFPSTKSPAFDGASIVLLPLFPAFAEGLGPDASETPRLEDAPNPGRGRGRSIRVMQGKGGP